MPNNIAVVGAGVSGLTCSVLLAEGGDRVTILADRAGADTTSAAAAAIWYPYDARPAEAVIPWALQTYEVLARLCADPTSGVSMLELRTLSRTSQLEIPDWALKLGAHPLALSSETDVSLTSNMKAGKGTRVMELAPDRPGSLSFPPRLPTAAGAMPGFVSGFALVVPLTDTTIYLDYLSRRFAAAGGILRGGVHFDELDQVPTDYDLIINCAGLGARALVNDDDLEPHRGQVAIVQKINLPYAVVCDDAPLMYAIPRANDCLFGGTNEVSTSETPDQSDTDRIVQECSRVLRMSRPQVKAARVGLRPYRRSGVRVARDHLRDGRMVVHNYGHGGSGFTLSWGCAQTVAQLVNMNGV